MSKKSEQNTPKAVQDCHDLLGWMLPQLDKFPRNRRFTLGERIETGLIFVLEKLVEAAFNGHRGKGKWVRLMRPGQ